MLQRTKGRLLLAALVITGMAGTPKNTTLSQEERKFCLTNLRKSKNEFVHSLKELSPVQLSYRPVKDDPNIQECIFLIASAERALDEQLKQAMDQPSRPAERGAIKLTDEQLIRMAADPDYPLLTGLSKNTSGWSSSKDAVESFLATRSRHVKYVRNTTEDLRNHVVQLEFGYIDCYQLLLLITHYSNRYLHRINDIIGNEAFPRS